MAGGAFVSTDRFFATGRKAGEMPTSIYGDKIELTCAEGHRACGCIADETACVLVTCEVPGVLEAGSHEISIIGQDMMPPLVIC